MHILIIETGIAPDPLDKIHGRYPSMFEALFAGRGFTFSTCSVCEGAMLPPLSGVDGILITGSPAGVYEPHPWIAPLEAFIRDALAQNIKTIGICFGHQIMAQALGGKVEKSAKGWGVGIHHYTPQKGVGTNIFDGVERVSCAVSHQDQVVALPEGAQMLAGSSFCPYGVIAYKGGAGLSFQMHPEFSAEFGRALIEARLDRIPPEIAHQGLSSYAAIERPPCVQVAEKTPINPGHIDKPDNINTTAYIEKVVHRDNTKHINRHGLIDIMTAFWL